MVPRARSTMDKTMRHISLHFSHTLSGREKYLDLGSHLDPSTILGFKYVLKSRYKTFFGLVLMLNKAKFVK